MAAWSISLIVNLALLAVAVRSLAAPGGCWNNNALVHTGVVAGAYYSGESKAAQLTGELGVTTKYVGANYVATCKANQMRQMTWGVGVLGSRSSTKLALVRHALLGWTLLKK